MQTKNACAKAGTILGAIIIAVFLAIAANSQTPPKDFILPGTYVELEMKDRRAWTLINGNQAGIDFYLWYVLRLPPETKISENVTAPFGRYRIAKMKSQRRADKAVIAIWMEEFDCYRFRSRTLASWHYEDGLRQIESEPTWMEITPYRMELDRHKAVCRPLNLPSETSNERFRAFAESIREKRGIK
ncbi:MAG: hypothetical protein MOB07_24235 [Acidobacteria bacterium]|nr:hypothetical protein [Acidobacteriota bacterium]